MLYLRAIRTHPLNSPALPCRAFLVPVAVALTLSLASCAAPASKISSVPQVAQSNPLPLPSPTSEPVAAVELPPGVTYWVTVGGYMASPSKELLQKAISYAAAHDTAAYNQLESSPMAVVPKAGLKVQLVEAGFLDGMVKIRPFGTTLEVWTVREAIEGPHRSNG